MTKILVKVGPKGQIVIPEALREAYRIAENGYVILEPGKEGIRIRSAQPPEDVIKWIRERRARLRARKARLGDLGNVDLEEEFEK